MDKIKNTEKVIQSRSNVPLFFRYMIKDAMKEKHIALKKNKVKIDFYQVDAFEPFPFYRPISKIHQ